MRAYFGATVDAFVDLLDREAVSVACADLGEIGRRNLERPGDGAIAFAPLAVTGLAIDTVARAAAGSTVC